MIDWSVFICFVIAGGIGVFTNYSITWFLRDLMRIDQLVANNTGLAIALLLNFGINKSITFQSTSPVLHELVVYSCIASMSLIFNHLIVRFMVGRDICSFYKAKITSTGCLFLWNYFMHSHYTFS